MTKINTDDDYNLMLDILDLSVTIRKQFIDINISLDKSLQGNYIELH